MLKTFIMDNVLKIPFAAFGNNWNDLQLFLKHKGNPPYEITDDLNLWRSEVKGLGNLTSVGGYLNLSYSEIEDLGNLTSVGGRLEMSYCKIESLRNLTSVGGYLDLRGTNIESLGNLTSVGDGLDLRRTVLSKIYTKEEIQAIVKVGGKIYL
jgi:hypothetical protein